MYVQLYHFSLLCKLQILPRDLAAAYPHPRISQEKEIIFMNKLVSHFVA